MVETRETSNPLAGTRHAPFDASSTDTFARQSVRALLAEAPEEITKADSFER
ncbi:hypothetical protein [Bradyrhizobium sp. AZCC 2230]|uniref:hypothetical protein n=1 Tax=Bradyrhizobium sp. AZCC 2230 TaxID=3117021 RepID=UPI002FF2312F